MTAREQPTSVTHFTRIEHLAAILQHGLLSDSEAHARSLLLIEVGNAGIKDQRRRRPVPIEPGGSVADYVPFYFGPRSPMMFAISRGNVPTYKDGTARLVYLVSSLERLHDLGLVPVLTDRNAALALADFRAFDPADLIDDEFIDWKLMRERYWVDFPDGTERRMAEALVHQAVPTKAFSLIVAQSEIVAVEARAILATAAANIPVDVRPIWYF